MDAAPPCIDCNCPGGSAKSGLWPRQRPESQFFQRKFAYRPPLRGGYLGTIEGYLGSYYRLKETQQEFVIFMIMSRPGDLIPAACTDHSGSIIGQVISKPT